MPYCAAQGSPWGPMRPGWVPWDQDVQDLCPNSHVWSSFFTDYQLGLTEGEMPPWPADPSYNHFVGENYLTDSEVALFEECYDTVEIFNESIGARHTKPLVIE